MRRNDLEKLQDAAEEAFAPLNPTAKERYDNAVRVAEAAREAEENGADFASLLSAFATGASAGSDKRENLRRMDSR